MAYVLNFLRSLRRRSAFVRTLHRHLREPYYRVLENIWRDGVEVDFPNGDRFRVHPRFLGMNLSEYEPKLVQRFCELVQNGMTVIDVGAHVGIYSLIASKRVGETGKVIAMEPSPANAKQLRRHLSINQCTNVEVVEAAAGDRTRKISFSYRTDPTDPVAFANSIAYDIGGERVSVPMLTLDNICEFIRPALFKIDVEGAELLALQGAKRVLSKHRPMVIVAIHPEPMKILGTTPKQLIGYMRKLGYVGRTLDGKMVEDSGFEELIFLPRTKGSS